MNASSLLSEPSKYIRLLLIAAAIAGIFLAMIWARAFYGSMKAWESGDAYLKTDKPIKAVTFFDRSIHWYTPFNPYIQKSAEALWKISEDAQDQGDLRLALMAAKAIRRGFVAARSFYTPGRDWIEKCDVRIHELLKISGEKESGVQPETQEVASVLEHPQVRGPDVLWSVLLLVGLLGWIGSAIGLITTGFKLQKKAGFPRSSSIMWGLLWGCFFTLWIVSMWKA